MVAEAKKSILFLEGADLIGKTTLKKYFNKNGKIALDRCNYISPLLISDGDIEYENDIIRIIGESLCKYKEHIYVLYTNNSNLLLERLEKRRKLRKGKLDPFDEETVITNDRYKRICSQLIKNHSNIHMICVDGKSVKRLYLEIMEIQCKNNECYE